MRGSGTTARGGNSLDAYGAKTQPVIDPPQADFELDVLFAPYGLNSLMIAILRAGHVAKELPDR